MGKSRASAKRGPRLQGTTKFLVDQAAKGAVRYVANKFSQSMRRRQAKKGTGTQAIVRKDRYKTHGTFKGNFNRKRAKFNKRMAQGSTLRVSNNGIISGDYNAYVGHGPAPYYMLWSAVEALVIKLFGIAGVQIRSVLDRVRTEDNLTYVASPYAVHLTHVDFGGLVTRHIYSVPAEAIYYDIARDLTDYIIGLDPPPAVPVSNYVTSKLKFLDLSLRPRDISGAEAAYPSAVLDLTDSWIMMKHTSELVLQNRTLATTSGTTDVAAGDNVLNNPLRGRRYEGTGTGLRARNVRGDVISQAGEFALSGATGLLAFTVASGAPAVTDNILVRPPLKNAFYNCVKDSKIHLEPGHIKRGYVNLSRGMFFNQLINRLQVYIRELNLTTRNNPIHIGFGKIEVFGFEKLCKVADSSSSQISVGYESNMIYRSVCVIKRHGVLTYTNRINGDA